VRMRTPSRRLRPVVGGGDVTPPIVLEAIEGVRRYRLAYWDAQIWAAAKLNQIEVIYSEDGPTGRPIGGVRFVNPLDTVRATP